MQPWRHAKMSARKANRSWQEDLCLHEFLDSAKAACPDLRHRVVLHNSDLGPYLLKRAFPNCSYVDEIAFSHINQDLGFVPSLQDWFETARYSTLMAPNMPDPDTLILEACESQMLDDASPVQEVLDLLTSAIKFCPTEPALSYALLMNGFGPILVRSIIGPARAVKRKNGGETIFDPSWTAEGIIVAHYSRIPTLSEALKPFSGSIR